jgi:hypothetical protein
MIESEDPPDPSTAHGPEARAIDQAQAALTRGEHRRNASLVVFLPKPLDFKYRSYVLLEELEGVEAKTALEQSRRLEEDIARGQEHRPGLEMSLPQVSSHLVPAVVGV